jgi:EAL domain-containing protein (putative c-di-GMP-specific phosphodiesterase class I)/CheY-like chemotaxis protein
MPEERQPRVLIVDDDAGSRGLVALALKRADMVAVEAASGEAGLELIGHETFDIVVCDLGMPGMSGLDLIRALRARSETATLPILLMTGSGHADTVIEALEAGATDFLAKPVRMDELVARVRAHVRAQTVWGELLQHELGARASVISALGNIVISAAPEVVAEQIVGLLGETMNVAFCSILGIGGSGRLAALATYDLTNGTLRGGNALLVARARDLLARTADGPWVEHRPQPAPGEAIDVFWQSEPELVARAPVYAGERIVAILEMGSDDSSPAARSEEARLLAAAVDLAGVVGAVAGSALADQVETQAQRKRLKRILSQRQFRMVYQPLVDLATDTVIGWEALTRFEDGTPPDVRFAEARANDLGVEFELAAIEAAIAGVRELPRAGILMVNISPTTIMSAARRVARALEPRDRAVGLELSEHAEIKDYEAVRKAIDRNLKGIEVAVDDAGAGYASLRHLLELRPEMAKIDISLVRGIDADPIRQALISGLAFYAQRTGCRLLAEGVEEEQERATLVGLGVELGQGYLFGRPESAADVRVH